MLEKIRNYVRNISFVRKVIAYYIVPSGYFDKKILNMPISANFKRRIEEVVSCPDNTRIPRVKDSGMVKNGNQIMHNGLLIKLGSYYGPEVAQQMYANKGVHEPQEEYVFQEVLKIMRSDSTMIELGSFWSFYSMWFNREVKNAKNYMVEPELFNMGSGQNNFKLNNLIGDFTNAYVGEKSSETNKSKTICVDDFVKEKNIDFVDILHSDIQGFEFDMLNGAKQTVLLDKIGYFFVSTHSNDIHLKCLDFLIEHKYQILVNVDLNETFAEDGLIVAKSKNYQGIDSIQVSKKVLSE